VLEGHEVKSLKTGNCNLEGAHCIITSTSLKLINTHIAPYAKSGTITLKGYNPDRIRVLLLHQKEFQKIVLKMKKGGSILIPTEIYVNSKGLIKVSVALAKALKKFEKRENIKQKDQERQMRKEMKHM
jgi:SsrA-binding protein